MSRRKVRLELELWIEMTEGGPEEFAGLIGVGVEGSVSWNEAWRLGGDLYCEEEACMGGSEEK